MIPSDKLTPSKASRKVFHGGFEGINFKYFNISKYVEDEGVVMAWNVPHLRGIFSRKTKLYDSLMLNLQKKLYIHYFLLHTLCITYYSKKIVFYLEYYKWNGLIAQKYDNFTFPSNAGSYPLEYTYNNNPNYPDTPSSFTCKSSLYDAKTDQNFGDNFALRYIGYMRPPADGTYKLEMGCDDVCELFINKSGIETSIGSLGYGE